jgi:hypothetical protein
MSGPADTHEKLAGKPAAGAGLTLATDVAPCEEGVRQAVTAIPETTTIAALPIKDNCVFSTAVHYERV